MFCRGRGSYAVAGKTKCCATEATFKGMSNLIPTPRIDKNGRTVIRHMKPEDTTQKTPVIPAVAVPEQTPQQRVREIIDLLQGGSMDHADLAMYLRYLDDDNSKTLPLFKKLLTTGTPQAQRAVESYLHEVIGDIKEAGDGGSSYDEDEMDDYDDHWNWIDRCPDAWHPHSTHNALRIWNTFNVMDEHGIEGNRYEIIHRITELGTMHNDLDPMMNPESMRNRFWRGAAAAAIGTEERNTERAQWGHIKEFVQWAGRHEDIAIVINTVKERRILHPEMLDQVIAEKAGISPAVREGVL